MNEELLYQDDNGVRITPSQIIFNDSSMSIGGIGEIAVTRTRRSRTGPIINLVWGSIFLVIGALGNWGGVILFGLIFVVGGIVWITRLRDSFNLVIGSGFARRTKLSSSDEDYIRNVARVLTEAIANRS